MLGVKERRGRQRRALREGILAAGREITSLSPAGQQPGGARPELRGARARASTRAAAVSSQANRPDRQRPS